MFMFLKANVFLMEVHFGLGSAWWGLLNYNIHKQKTEFSEQEIQNSINKTIGGWVPLFFSQSSNRFPKKKS